MQCFLVPMALLESTNKTCSLFCCLRLSLSLSLYLCFFALLLRALEHGGMTIFLDLCRPQDILRYGRRAKDAIPPACRAEQGPACLDA